MFQRLFFFQNLKSIQRLLRKRTVSFFLSFFSSLLCNTISLHLVQTLSFFSCRKKNQIYPLTMLQEMWNAPPGLRPSKSAPCSPAKPLGVVPRTRSESFHVAHKVPVGDTPYVRAKNVQVNLPFDGFFHFATNFFQSKNLINCKKRNKVFASFFCNLEGFFPFQVFFMFQMLSVVLSFCFCVCVFSWWIRIRRERFRCSGQPLMREIEWTVL